jgi:RHS repeat-associated protein
MIYAGGRAVAQATTTAAGPGSPPPTLSYLYDDALGSVQTITNASGAVQQIRDYGPFGDLRSATGSTNVPYGFTGHEDDPEAGLTNMGGRIYDQAVGQFLQADPIIAEPASQGLNRYAYVNNSPMNFVDPSGFASQSAQGACYWPGCSGFGALASGVGAAGPAGLAGAGLGVGMGFVVASNIGVGGPSASSVAFSGSSTITGGGAGSGAGTSAGGGFNPGQALTPEAQAGSFGGAVAGSIHNLAIMAEAGPGPVTETAMVSRSSVSSARTTAPPGVVQEGNFAKGGPPKPTDAQIEEEFLREFGNDPPPVPRTPPFNFDTAKNREALSAILFGEMGGRYIPESISVGWTVLNRMVNQGTSSVAKVSAGNQYAKSRGAPAIVKIMSSMLLRGEIADPTAGSVYFFSPQGMPGPGQSCAGFDCGRGLQFVPGTNPPVMRNFPSWADPARMAPQPAGTDPMRLLLYRP